ncbi:MAG TPA: hypothetical protein VGP85_06355 [Pyrinomonadaceae bacterium]|nr:hypothetical protein [Pyrinomonadaceae bacterium]
MNKSYTSDSVVPPQQKNIAATARAFATYSLIPYLGILFCPGAVFLGGVGVFRSYREASNSESRLTCYFSVLAGIIIAAVQLFLWWILYKVPLWARGV